MKYQKPSLTYLDDATTAIQHVDQQQGKVQPPSSDGPVFSSSINAYDVDE